MKPLRMAGGLLVVVGLVLAFAPTLVHDPGPAPDLFEAIERRVRWGALIGIGALLVVRTKLRPWRLTLAHLVLWGTGGFLVARLIGVALDGAGSLRQWMWVAIEAAIIVAAAVYLRRKHGAGARRA